MGGEGKPETAGSTLLSVLLRGNQLYVCNLGDCRAVCSRQGVNRTHVAAISAVSAAVAVAAVNGCLLRR